MYFSGWGMGDGGWGMGDVFTIKQYKYLDLYFDYMENKRVAILFFGLSKTLERTIDSIKQNLLTSLDENLISYDIFIHTYKIFGSYNNMWSNEYVSEYNNEDIEKILNPKYFIFDNQETIINSIDFNEYYKKLGNWTFEDWSEKTIEMTKYLIKNMCLALYSKKQITTLFEKHKDEYDYAIIVRPDMFMENKIDVNFFGELNDNNIIIPEKDWYHGCNDRFCIGTPNVILYYGMLFDRLQKYSEEKSIISEVYLLDKLNERSINIIPKKIEYYNMRL
jgi:hypothetical protein